jgi:WD40 repeat protein
LTVIAGGDYRSRAAVMTQGEADFLVQMLAAHKEWSKLWTLAFDLSFISSVRIVNLLARAGWKPERDDERMAFDELIELASGEMVVSADEISRFLPPAIERARVRVAGRVNDVAFAPHRQVIAIGTGQRKVALWDFQRGAIESALTGFDHSLGRVVFLPDGTLLCAERTRAEEPCSILSWRDGRSFTLAEHQGSVTAIEPVGMSHALSAGRDHQVALWDVEAGRVVARLETPNWPRGARVSSDGKCAALLYDGVAFTDLPQLNRLTTLDGWEWNGVARCAAFSPDDASLIVGKFNGDVLVCQCEGNSLMLEPITLLRHAAQAQGIETLRDRGVVITAGADGGVQFTRWANRAHIGSLQIRGERLTSLRVSPDASFMAIGDSDASMSLWDLRALDVPMLFTRPLAKSAPAHMAVISALAGSANLDPRARRALQFLEGLLRHRFRYDVEIDEAPRIQAGEFDIEIEE